jgi:protein-disulfide isomerase
MEKGKIQYIVIIAIILIFFIIALTRSRNPITNLENDDPFLKKGDGDIVIVEFCDYLNKNCAEVEPIVREVIDSYDNIKLVFRDFPLMNSSRRVAEAAACANAQGKFWEFHRAFLEDQNYNKLTEYARYAKMNLRDYQTCLEDNFYSEEINKDITDGKNLGITIVPTFFINKEKKLEGFVSLDEFKKAINETIS